MVRLELVWLGWDWFGLVCPGLVWMGLVWFRLRFVRFGGDRFDLAGTAIVLVGITFGLLGLVWFG